MRIGIVSDTHMPAKAKALPDIMLRAFKDTDHIIHAGDIQCADVLSSLSALAPVTAVAGNTDPPELKSVLGEKKVIEFGGFRFGVFHGHGEKGKTMDRAIERFRDDGVDCIVFGHSHIPYCAYHGCVLLFNPGSPTDKRRNRYYSLGLIDVGVSIVPHLVYFDAGGNIAEL